MELHVVAKDPIAADTVRIRFAAPGESMPAAFSPGSHIVLGFAGLSRRYSLTADPVRAGYYEICVLRSPDSQGGSRYLHDTLTSGQRVQLLGTGNDFSLEPAAAHSLFIAGGIGITPFFSMTEALREAGASFEMHYAARDATRFLPLPEALAAVTRHYVGRHGESGLDVATVLAGCSATTHVYVCGPQAMIAAVRSAAATQGLPATQVHFETFGYAAQAGDRTLSVTLARSGMQLTVAPGQSLLDALLANDVWAGYECRRGTCGSCLTGVVAGTPLHRDSLDPALRAGAMCTCVSWAQGDELVLDL